MVLDSDFSKRLYQDYLIYCENDLTKRRFNHSDILPLIERLKDKDIFKVNKVGESVGGRSINLVTYGEGEIPVFLWSQMHGDESTATMAIFDIFNFLSANDDFNPCRKKFSKKLKIYFMPMVNPDGAELFQRETALNIDINRDAARTQTTEAKVLFEVFNSVKAKFGFNLHDQDRVYSAGQSHRSAAISFLAPPFNFNRDINKTRGDAMKLIVMMNEILMQFIPGHIAKYTDEFEPRAFGDNFQKLGTSTILIESGSWHEDPEKQFIRKLNFIALLAAFKSISDGSYKKNDIDSYNKIPDNQKNMMDLVIRNVKYTWGDKEYYIDLGINRTEVNINGSHKFYYESMLEEIGDLSVFHGYEDYDFEGCSIHPGKIYGREFESPEEIKKIDFISLYSQGYLFIKLFNQQTLEDLYNLPINIVLNNSFPKSVVLKAGSRANFYLEKNGQIEYVVVNGFMFNLRSKTGEIKNGLSFYDI